jgi:hypothetical protein
LDKEFRQFVNDGRWIAKNYQYLLSIYKNRYIAVRNEKVLNNDPDKLNLIYRLQKIYGKNETPNFSIEFIY